MKSDDQINGCVVIVVVLGANNQIIKPKPLNGHSDGRKKRELTEFLKKVATIFEITKSKYWPKK